MIKVLQKLTAFMLVCCAWLGSGNAWGQVQYVPFSTTGSLTAQTGWSNNTGTAGQLMVVAGNLSYSNFPEPTGNKVALKSSDGEDAKLALASSVTSGSIYASFLVQPESGFLANSSVDGNYFFHFIGSNGSSSPYISRVSIKSGSAANTFNLGIYRVSTSGASPSATEVFGTSPVDYPTGQTYLIVVEYDITNKTSSVWINPALGGSTEPAALVTSSFGTGTLPTEVGNIAIRQSNGSGLGTGNLEIDEIRVGTTWAAVTPSSAPNTTPRVSPSLGSLDFGDVLVGASTVSSYTIAASNVPAGENVTLSVTGPFALSSTATGTFTNTLSFTGAELSTAKNIYVKASPTAQGVTTGEIIHTLAGATDVKVGLVVNGASPYVQNFTNCVNGAEIVGGWSQYSVTGDQTWACTTYGKEGNGVQISGFEGGSNVNEDWLISPKLDLSTFSIPLMSVNHRTKYAGNDLIVKVSTNYSGTGSPTAATWTNLATLTADDADVWKVLENLSLAAYKSANSYVAFVYTSTASASARWTLDNFEVQNVESYITTDLATMRFAETAVGNASAAQQFTFQGGGFTESLIVAAPANFELSKDGTAFSTSLTYTPAEAAANNTVYVRLKPLTAVVTNEGPISFTSGTGPSVTRGNLIGSSILKANTLDVVTWNMEWFGSSSSGPSNEELQYENAKKVFSGLNADIIGVQEVVDENKLRTLATEIGYNYESMTMSWQGSSEQKVAFLYKPEVVTVKKEKVLLSKLYEDIRAGRATLPGYPVGNSLFWASGRLPYMVQFEANIDGVKQLYNVVNFHAKANTTNPTEDYSRRLYDAQVLKDSLNAQYANANLIILGDYNDDVDVSVVGTNQPSSFNMFVTDDNYKTLTYDLSVAGAFTYESGSLRSFLDHMIISKSLEDEYIANSIMIESQFLESISDFRSTASDHLPVSARFYISTDNTTGIADATKGQFKVYPNPASNYVNLVLPERAAKGNVNLSVWSVDGRRVFETTGNLNAANQNLNSKVSNLAKGVYIIKINAGNEVYQSRLMKQ